MGLFRQQKRQNEKCKEIQPKSCLKKQPVTIEMSTSEDPNSCCEPEICCEPKQCCDCQCELLACCKPGCSLRKPCLSCVKKGVRVQVISKKCEQDNFNIRECPKKLMITTRCEIKKSDECHDADKIDCCMKISEKCKQEVCKKEDDIIDCCKMTKEKSKNEGNDCISYCVKKSNSCKNFKQCPCTSCKSCIKTNDKCEKSCSNEHDDEKCCVSSCQTRNSCKTSKQVQQECVPNNSSCMSPCCPKPSDFMENYCSDKVNENCTEYEQGDCMSYFPIQQANCCGPQKITEIPSTCLPSVGSFVVPHISKQLPMPCPCGSRSCGNSILIFQQAIQSQPYITTKRFS